MIPGPWWAIFGVALFASASFYFALAEAALFSLGRWRAQQLPDQKRGAIVLELLKQPEDLLATISLGNTLANGGIVGFALWQTVDGVWPLAPTLLFLLILVLVGCEVLPKTLAVRAPGEWAQRVAPVLARVQALTGGFQRTIQRLSAWTARHLLPRSLKPLPPQSEEEYQELIDLAHQQGALAAGEREIILQIVNLDRKTARDVMRPRSRMAAIPDDLRVEEMIAKARQIGHRRIPMFDESPDTIVAILDAQKLLLDPNHDLAEAIEFPSFVPESMNCLTLLQSLQRQHRGLAVVLDEFGGTAGIVRLEDILQEVVGQIRTETELGGFVAEKLGDGRWRVNGTMAIEDFRREYPPLGPTPEVDTMAGLLLSRLEVVPTIGQSAIIGQVRLTAHVVDDRRIRELLVDVLKKR